MKKRRGFCFKWLGIFLMLLFGLTAGGKTAEAAGYSQITVIGRKGLRTIFQCGRWAV